MKGVSASQAGLSPTVEPVPVSPPDGASIPDAYELGRRCSDSLSPDMFTPLVRRVCEDIYERLMESVQDYLCDNVEMNIAGRIRNAEESDRRSRMELYEIDKVIGFNDGGTRAERISKLQADATKYHILISEVASKFGGESRGQTALRYIREREAQAMSTGTAKTAKPVEGEACQRGPKDAPIPHPHSE